jgi:hypothetical protein
MKHKMNVRLLVPGSGPEPEQSLRSCLDGAEKFARKNHVPASREQDYWAALSELFHIHGAPSFPAAAFLALADNQAKDFLCISPVHLEVGVEKIFLSAVCDQQITAQQARHLIAALNVHFQNDGLKIDSITPSLWRVSLPGKMNIETSSIYQVNHQSIYSMLPAGNDALYWHRFLNEAQMLLFELSENQASATYGDSVINGLWVWGEGPLPDRSPKRQWNCVISDSVLIKAIAQWADIPCFSLNEMNDSLEQFKNILIIDDSSYLCNTSQPLSSTNDSYQRFPGALIQSLIQGMNQGIVKLVSLDTLSHQYTWRKKPFWRFW